MNRIYTLIFAFFITAYCVNAQDVRYIDEVFENVDVSADNLYGANITIITVADTNIMMPTLDSLYVDIYSPADDTTASRPLVILQHTGNFLPNLVNGAINGDKSDPYLVHLANKIARRGYVVAVPNYRLGWNPISSDQQVRTETLINAAYRGVQDSRMAARYFRRSVEEASNPFGIDTTKFIAWGVGTGAYVSLATTTIDQYEDVLLPKFIGADDDGNPLPMVLEAVSGDPNGEDSAILNVPNHVGYGSDYQLCVNMGGALGDTTWLDASDPPIISFAVPTDPFAPYTTGILKVPTTGDLVVEVSGSYDVQRKAAEFGNNTVFNESVFNDVYTDAANERNNGMEGLMPLPRPSWPTDPMNPDELSPLEASPWEFWDVDTWSTDPFGQLGLNGPGGPCEGIPVTYCNWHVIALGSNPDMSFEKADTYQDSIMGYFGPRACVALDLAECAALYSDTEDQLLQQDVIISPNPTKDAFVIDAKDLQIESILAFTMDGRRVMEIDNVQNSSYSVSSQDWHKGFYFIHIKTNEGVITKKLIKE